MYMQMQVERTGERLNVHNTHKHQLVTCVVKTSPPAASLDRRHEKNGFPKAKSVRFSTSLPPPSQQFIFKHHHSAFRISSSFSKSLFHPFSPLYHIHDHHYTITISPLILSQP
jgi:hypothetical protein